MRMGLYIIMAFRMLENGGFRTVPTSTEFPSLTVPFSSIIHGFSKRFRTLIHGFRNFEIIDDLIKHSILRQFR